MENESTPGTPIDTSKVALDRRPIRRERLRHLKEVKALANLYLEQNLAIKGQHAHTWESSVIENNIKQLTEIIKKTNKGLHDKALDQFADEELEMQRLLASSGSILARSSVLNHLRKVKFGAEGFTILRFSPSYSITFDLYWVTDGTVGDQIGVSFNFSLTWGRMAASIAQMDSAYDGQIMSVGSTMGVMVWPTGVDHGGFTTYGDQERDYHMIGVGYNH